MTNNEANQAPTVPEPAHETNPNELTNEQLQAIRGGNQGILGRSIQYNRMRNDGPSYSLIGTLSYFGDPWL